MTERLTIEQLRALPAKKKPKYGNRKVEHNGILFESIKERDRYKDLLLEQKAGEIRELQLQPVFDLKVNGKLICKYRADFSYIQEIGQVLIVEDCKGFKTPAYRLKAKLFEAIKGFKIYET